MVLVEWKTRCARYPRWDVRAITSTKLDVPELELISLNKMQEVQVYSTPATTKITRQYSQTNSSGNDAASNEPSRK